MDCNEEIKRLIAERMEKGRVAYGHGLIQNDEARKHGLKEYDWVQESIEEALDLRGEPTDRLNFSELIDAARFWSTWT
ncbi:MAG: hypothetical protein EBV21_09010 [Betaproteobacteria bacterium]|nr:hypothetical protein [Betaproteobacteria bacterium]